jgi:AcrR family transcriptional regulator
MPLVADELGLRERKKLQTRQLLAETARRLFVEHGFEAVSVAAIARAADVSEATVFNYFPTKEDLVLSGLELFEEQLLVAIRDRPTGESVLSAFGRFVLEPRGLVASKDPAAVMRLVEVSRIIAGSPGLLAREQQVLASYTRALAGVIAEETAAKTGDPAPAVAASALIGVHRALIEYVRAQLLAGETDLARLARKTRSHGERALALLAHGLDDFAKRPG